MPQSRLLGYKSTQYLGSVAASASLEQNSRLPSLRRDHGLESRKFSLAAFLRFAFVPEGHRTNALILVEEVKILKELALVREMFQYAEERALESRDETSI